MAWWTWQLALGLVLGGMLGVLAGVGVMALLARSARLGEDWYDVPAQVALRRQQRWTRRRLAQERWRRRMAQAQMGEAAALQQAITALAAEFAGVYSPQTIERYIRLESIDPTTNRARFYLLQWQPTLDGRLVLLRIWGRLGTLGHVRTLLWADDARAPTHIERVVHQRLLHGYEVVAWQ